MKTFTAKDGVLRLYNAGPATPYYLKCLFVNSDLSAPMGRNRPEEVLVLDRMKFDGNTHFIQGSDAAIADPLPMSFSFRTFDRIAGLELMTWILKGTSAHKTTVTLTSTKGTSRIADYAGQTWTTNTFTDTSKKCYNVEVKYTPDTAAAGYRTLTLKLKEVFFNPGEQIINEGEDAVNISLSGLVYGSVDFGSVDFSSGTNILL